jgi:hypothetical protein
MYIQCILKVYTMHIYIQLVKRGPTCDLVPRMRASATRPQATARHTTDCHLQGKRWGEGRRRTSALHSAPSCAPGCLARACSTESESLNMFFYCCSTFLCMKKCCLGGLRVTFQSTLRWVSSWAARPLPPRRPGPGPASPRRPAAQGDGRGPPAPSTRSCRRGCRGPRSGWWRRSPPGPGRTSRTACCRRCRTSARGGRWAGGRPPGTISPSWGQGGGVGSSLFTWSPR